MLTSSTKQKIDNARDILVGKIPTPTGQVEHITLALMYKFMNDMDEINRELGGTPKFFSGDYRQYSWKQVMDRSLSSYERVTLYGEGLEKMSRNPNIPTLFREIFKRAFLPFRDPEVLTLFLKQIDEFSYDHSEELGNAFEYLLSIMGTQGEAGQLRSPRHIIDFMVNAVDPKKTDRILDPACGTAGFLISAYKHILEENTVKGSNRAGTKLTIEERKRLAQNFVGYDISHDMVRLSLVNMYLHEFPDPKIYEYDTLSSEERWDEDFDCILANPPFMTPKGGIRPHRRFSIQANRSEVLFVDYIMEHLSPNGKAGVIVPEGIIFQSANAYKALRKMFVEQNYIYAVVSLPAGVFQPYSGVKTSILLMDRVLAKKTEDILFVKIDNDGFDPGAQRRPIDKNDLPKALELLQAYKKALVEGSAVHPELVEGSKAHLVPKSRIAESGDYNLTGDRYRETGIHIHHEWPVVELGDVVENLDSKRKPINKGSRISGPYPYFGATGIVDYVNEYLFDEKLVLVGEDGAKWGAWEKTAFIVEGKCWVNNHAHVLRPVRKKVLDEFLVAMLNSMDLSSYITGVTVPKLNQQKLNSIKIPLPPLEVQRAIVAEIDGYQKIIDGAKQVVENYQPSIPINPEWPTPSFADAPFEIIDGDRGVNYPKKEDFSPSGYCVFLNTKNVRSDGFSFSELEFITKEKDTALRKGKLRRGDVVITTRGTIGNTGLYNESVEFDHIRINSGMLIFRPDTTKLSGSYLFHFFQSKNFKAQRDSIVSGAAQPQLPIRSLNDANIPLPSLDTQKQIVAQIEGEQRLVAANKKLVEIFERKIRERIDEVWGRET